MSVTVEEAVRLLENLDENEPEAAHEFADELLLQVLSLRPETKAVADAFRASRIRVRFWYA